MGPRYLLSRRCRVLALLSTALQEHSSPTHRPLIASCMLPHMLWRAWTKARLSARTYDITPTGGNGESGLQPELERSSNTTTHMARRRRAQPGRRTPSCALRGKRFSADPEQLTCRVPAAPFARADVIARSQRTHVDLLQHGFRNSTVRKRGGPPGVHDTPGQIPYISGAFTSRAQARISDTNRYVATPMPSGWPSSIPSSTSGSSVPAGAALRNPVDLRATIPPPNLSRARYPDPRPL
jgi:hypothetical protein